MPGLLSCGSIKIPYLLAAILVYQLPSLQQKDVEEMDEVNLVYVAASRTLVRAARRGWGKDEASDQANG